MHKNYFDRAHDSSYLANRTYKRLHVTVTTRPRLESSYTSVTELNPKRSGASKGNNAIRIRPVSTKRPSSFSALKEKSTFSICVTDNSGDSTVCTLQKRAHCVAPDSGWRSKRSTTNRNSSCVSKCACYKL